MRRILGTTAALVLLVATSVVAQQVYSGTVLRIDPSAGVIVFDDGRMLQTTADSVIISGNQRVMFSGLRQGHQVAIYQAQPVALRDGRYIVMSDAGARAATGTMAPAPSAVITGPTTAVVPPPPPPPAVVTMAPPAATVVTQPGPIATKTEWGPAFEVSGRVLRSDATSQVIVLDSGRNVHLTEDTQVLLNGVQPVPLSTLHPGSHVVIRSLSPFASQNGRDYVPMTEVARGTVVRMDQPGVLVLNDGRTVRTAADTVVLVDNRPAQLTTVPPGARVVVYQNGSTMTIVSEAAAASPSLVPQAGLKERENDWQRQ
jgi:hypothetical protein